MSTLAEYLAEIQRNLASGDATELTHRSALKAFLESAEPGIVALHEPKRIHRIGAPDFRVVRRGVPVGHVETKDVGTDLDEMERGRGASAEQFARYSQLPNWILTDYLEFRWYAHGERRRTVRIADRDRAAHLAPVSDAETAIAELLREFYQFEVFTVGTSRDLALTMAGLTQTIRRQVVASLDDEPGSRWLRDWHTAFRDVLIPDLDDSQFSDLFAQTLAYGLFVARVHATGEFTRIGAAHAIPKANPFLRKLFDEVTGVDLPDSIAWAVDDLVDLLRHADLAAILADLGAGGGKEDPVVHFYETFLAAYAPGTRKVRGVYYTPEPVVRYIVRSINHLLKTRFSRPRALADENVLILDPAVGTGSFLFFVIEQIREAFARQPGAWNAYVNEHLLDRLFGFELLMPAYAVAHLKLGLQLKDLGVTFPPGRRLGVYLTNTLEEALQRSRQLFADWIAEEANAAAEVKRDRPIMVVLGNPPWRGVSANRGAWITRLVDDYRQVDGRPLGEKKVWLKNDYVKFLRFGQWRIERTGHGILAFITDHSYLDSPTFRGMRQSLLRSFDEIYILNLHGNQKRHEAGPDGRPEENVFDIREGAAIALFVKQPNAKHRGVRYGDLWGERREKYNWLAEHDVSNTKWRRLDPHSPTYALVPVPRRGKREYQRGWAVTDIFPVGSNGVQTSRDALVVDFTERELTKKIAVFLDPDLSDRAVRHRFFAARTAGRYEPGDTRGWRLAEARARLRAVPLWRRSLIPFLYRPFDERRLLYLDDMVDWPRRAVMRHLQQPGNWALCIGRAGLVVSGSWDLVFCADRVLDHNLFYRGSSLNFPLYLYPDGRFPKDLFTTGNGRVPNLSAAFVRDAEERLRLQFIPDDCGDLRRTFGPEDVFHYVYAMLHSPAFRSRYAEFLKSDFPRLPFTGDLGLFRSLVKHGAELVSLHLLKHRTLDDPANFLATWPIDGDNRVENVRFEEERERDRALPPTGRVFVNRTQYFDRVPSDVWRVRVGGYQVCDKWLKDRKGRLLSYDDIQCYQKVLLAIAETVRLMRTIDETIPSWPVPGL
jgi:hypothetical protein